MRFYGKSTLEQPVVFYIRRRDRLHALVSRRKRRKLRMLQRLADTHVTVADIQRERNRLLAERAPALNAAMLERTGLTLDEARDKLADRLETWNRLRDE